MSQFPVVRIEKVFGQKSDWWKLSESCSVPHPVANYTIPEGYVSDLISSPWAFYPIIHPHGDGSVEAIAHDFEHEHGLFDAELGTKHARHLSNLMLAVRMIQNRAPIWKVFLMLAYTTALSWVTWNSLNRPKKK